mmetsp:Transcript_35919/g.116900  ORF Transcript_35919/g.116900 Transcript_35919/m.116900 type:complete len:361 (-) Transcript_35919:517-1599(-)
MMLAADGAAAAARAAGAASSSSWGESEAAPPPSARSRRGASPSGGEAFARSPRRSVTSVAKVTRPQSAGSPRRASHSTGSAAAISRSQLSGAARPSASASQPAARRRRRRVSQRSAGSYSKRARSSSRENLFSAPPPRPPPPPPPTLASAKSPLKTWRWNIFSSSVPAESSRQMVTSRVWPSRKTRPAACLSVAGFQSGSKRTSRLAEVRLKPVPPALVERRNAVSRECGALNRLTSSCRFSFGTLPSMRTEPRPSLDSPASMRSSEDWNWQHTTTRSPAAATAGIRPRRAAALPTSPAAAEDCAAEVGDPSHAAPSSSRGVARPLLQMLRRRMMADKCSGPPPPPPDSCNSRRRASAAV